MYTCLVCVHFSAEEKVKELEKKVNELIEESTFARERGELQLVSITSYCDFPIRYYQVL